jgi:hypothetical protein
VSLPESPWLMTLYLVAVSKALDCFGFDLFLKKGVQLIYYLQEWAMLHHKNFFVYDNLAIRMDYPPCIL